MKKRGIGDLFTAWALRRSGRADQGQKLLATWLAEERSRALLLGEESAEPLANWCLRTFDESDVALPARLQDETYRVIQHWRRLLIPPSGRTSAPTSWSLRVISATAVPGSTCRRAKEIGSSVNRFRCTVLALLERCNLVP